MLTIIPFVQGIPFVALRDVDSQPDAPAAPLPEMLARSRHCSSALRPCWP